MGTGLDRTKISVIMAVHNNGETVSEAIDSIIAQTYQDWDLIICDDHSTDGTYEILLSYRDQYSNKIKVLRNEINSKLAFSLNRCLQHAQGKYIARMDGDDVSLPERFEKQLQFMESHPEYDVVGTAMIPFDHNGERAQRAGKETPEKFDLLWNSCFAHATIMMRKSAYDHLNGYVVSRRTQRGQDYDMWFRFFAAGFRGYNMPLALYKVRENVEDLKRRTFINRLYAAQTAFIGYKLLNFPLQYYVFALRPIIAGLVPRTVMFWYHNKALHKPG